MTDHEVNIQPRNGVFGGTLFLLHCTCGHEVLAAAPETAEQFKQAHLQDNCPHDNVGWKEDRPVCLDCEVTLDSADYADVGDER